MTVFLLFALKCFCLFNLIIIWWSVERRAWTFLLKLIKSSGKFLTVVHIQYVYMFVKWSSHTVLPILVGRQQFSGCLWIKVIFLADEKLLCCIWSIFWGKSSAAVRSLQAKQPHSWHVPHRLVSQRKSPLSFCKFVMYFAKLTSFSIPMYTLPAKNGSYDII